MLYEPIWEAECLWNDTQKLDKHKIELNDFQHVYQLKLCLNLIYLFNARSFLLHKSY